MDTNSETEAQTPAAPAEPAAPPEAKSEEGTPQPSQLEGPGERTEESDKSDQSDVSEPGSEAQDAADPEEPADEGEPGSDTAPADDPLSQLVAQAQSRRLSPADEERAAKLLQEALLDGRAGVGRAIEALPKLAWVIGVNAVTVVWQEMKPTFRTRLLAGLARVDSESARRMRLSLARGIFKQDVPAALKIAVSVAKDMRVKEAPGTIGVKNAQIFANVFIGRSKPWVTQLPLAELKPAEADLLVQTGIAAVFAVPHPPATQLGMLKWAAEGGRLERLSEAATAAVVKGVQRWNGKWRTALRREVAELPEAIASALRLDVAAPAEPAPRSAERETAEEEGSPAERGESEIDEASTEAPEGVDVDEDEDDEDEDEDDEEEERGERPAAPSPPRPRPVYESKTMPSRGGREQREPRDARDLREPREREPRDLRESREPRSFNLPDTLRQIDQYVNGLRNELQQAQNRLRQRDDDRGRRREPVERAGPIAGAPTPDELARLNQQLEARNVELQARIDEMREDAEMRAASGAAPVETPAEVVDAAEQLRSLLALKLQDDFADFLALEQGGPDLVVKQHYPVLLRHVFEVLRLEGVKLAEPPAEGAPPA